LILQDPKDIQELNVHSVIYDHALKDAYNMESTEAIESVWNCMYLCLDHFVDLDSFTVGNQTNSQTALTYVFFITYILVEPVRRHAGASHPECDHVL